MSKQSNFGDTVYKRYGSIAHKSLHHPYYFNEKLHFDYWENNRWQHHDSDPKFIPLTIIAIASNGTWLLSDGRQTDIDIFRGEFSQVLSEEWPDERFEEKAHLQILVVTEEEMNEEIKRTNRWYFDNDPANEYDPQQDDTEFAH